MTRFEAAQALKAGKKLTHRYFDKDEWVMGTDDGNYIMEDGVKCTAMEFWKWRTNPVFNIDWEIYKEQPTRITNSPTKCRVFLCPEIVGYRRGIHDGQSQPAQR